MAFVREDAAMSWAAKSRKVLRAAVTAVLLGAGVSHAGPAPVELPAADRPAPDGAAVTVGVGAAVVPDYEGSDDYGIVPGLYLRAGRRGGRYLELQGLVLRANVLAEGPWELGPTLRWRMGRGDVASDRVDRMEDVDASLEAGGFASLTLGRWTLKAQAAQDVAGGHGGAVVDASCGYSRRLGPLFASLSVGAAWASEDYMEAYFGVDAGDAARSGLEEFDAGAGVKDVGALLLLRYSITRTWGAMVLGKYARLVGDAADSPLVRDEGSENQGMGALLVTYRF